VLSRLKKLAQFGGAAHAAGDLAGLAIECDHNGLRSSPDCRDCLEFTLSTVAAGLVNYDVRIFVMKDATGNELFRVEATDLPASRQEEESSSLIYELYDLAHKQALRVDEKLGLAASLLDRA